MCVRMSLSRSRSLNYHKRVQNTTFYILANNVRGDDLSEISWPIERRFAKISREYGAISEIAFLHPWFCASGCQKHHQLSESVCGRIDETGTKIFFLPFCWHSAAGTKLGLLLLRTSGNSSFIKFSSEWKVGQFLKYPPQCTNNVPRKMAPKIQVLLSLLLQF